MKSEWMVWVVVRGVVTVRWLGRKAKFEASISRRPDCVRVRHGCKGAARQVVAVARSVEIRMGGVGGGAGSCYRTVAG